MSRQYKVLITGLPGCGKTTQTKKISDELGYCMVKTGEIMRELAKIDDERGRHIKRAMETGDLVDDKIASEIVKDRICKEDCTNGFVMDGYPRAVEQLNYFDPHYDKVFYLKISPETAKKRLGDRGRADDKPEIIEHRLKIQQEDLNGVLDYYYDHPEVEVIEIDGEQNIDDVFKDISAKL